MVLSSFPLFRLIVTLTPIEDLRGGNLRSTNATERLLTLYLFTPRRSVLIVDLSTNGKDQNTNNNNNSVVHYTASVPPARRGRGNLRVSGEVRWWFQRSFLYQSSINCIRAYKSSRWSRARQSTRNSPNGYKTDRCSFLLLSSRSWINVSETYFRSARLPDRQDWIIYRNV